MRGYVLPEEFVRFAPVMVYFDTILMKVLLP